QNVRARRTLRVREEYEPRVAQQLVFEFGRALGFTDEYCITLIEVAGTFGALKLLVGVATQGQRLAGLQREGKLIFPEATGDQQQLPPPRRRGGRGARKRPSSRKEGQ